MFQGVVITAVAIAIPVVTFAVAVGCVALVLRVLDTREQQRAASIIERGKDLSF